MVVKKFMKIELKCSHDVLIKGHLVRLASWHIDLSFGCGKSKVRHNSTRKILPKHLQHKYPFFMGV